MKLKIILASLAVIAYLAFAPVFIYLEHSTNDESRNLETSVDYSISGWPNTTFNYYLLYATNEAVLISDSFSLNIVDFGKTLKTFEIKRMVAIIDGKEFVIEMATDVTMELDRSTANGFAGNQGAADFRFTLPKVPTDTIVVKVVGIANYDDGTSENITKNIAQTVETKEFVTTLTGYYLARF